MDCNKVFVFEWTLRPADEDLVQYIPDDVLSVSSDMPEVHIDSGGPTTEAEPANEVRTASSPSKSSYSLTEVGKLRSDTNQAIEGQTPSTASKTRGLI